MPKIDVKSFWNLHVQRKQRERRIAGPVDPIEPEAPESGETFEISFIDGSGNITNTSTESNFEGTTDDNS